MEGLRQQHARIADYNDDDLESENDVMHYVDLAADDVSEERKEVTSHYDFAAMLDMASKKKRKQKSEQAPAKRTRHDSNTKTTDKRSRVVYLENASEEFNKAQKSTNTETAAAAVDEVLRANTAHCKAAEDQSTTLNMLTSSLTVDSLQREFGASYREGTCDPRTFAVHLNEHLSDEFFHVVCLFTVHADVSECGCAALNDWEEAISADITGCPVE